MRPFIVALAAVLFLAGCSGTATDGASGSGGRAAVAAPPKQPDAGTARSTETVRLPPAQAVVYTADLSMRAGDVARASAEAKRIAAAAGGYVGNENSTEDPGSRPSATIVFKIPSARYQSVLDQLSSSQVGTRLSLRQQADDVGQEVADVASRIKSAQATLASFRRLLDRAHSVGDVVRLEQEIASRESDLESLQARQKALSEQTSYATVTLRLNGTTVTRRAHHHAKGFAGGASSGWHAFTVFVTGLALVVGWLLPFLGLAVLIGLPALWVWRRRRAARSTPPTAA